MAVVVHTVHPVQGDLRKSYDQVWRQLDEAGLTHPPGRQIHVAWVEGDVFHVVDVWDSPAEQESFVQNQLGPLLGEAGIGLAGEQEVRELLRVVVRPD
jgi:hypothetical protein